MIRGDLVIDVPPESQMHRQVVRKQAEYRDITLNASVHLQVVEVDKADLQEAAGDLQRLQEALEREWQLTGLDCDPAVLPVLQRTLREGDIISLDFGVEHRGWHGDTAVTIAVGDVDPEAEKLMATTHEAMELGIEQMVPGNRLSDIGHAVEKRALKEGYGVVHQFVGHGIGREMHEPPQVPNYGRPGRGPRLRAGMVFAIEPMVNVGSDKVRVLEDDWTAVTVDGSLSAHFEHTVLITDDGPEVLTRIPGSH